MVEIKTKQRERNYFGLTAADGRQRETSSRWIYNSKTASSAVYTVSRRIPSEHPTLYSVTIFFLKKNTFRRYPKRFQRRISNETVKSVYDSDRFSSNPYRSLRCSFPSLFSTATPSYTHVPSSRVFNRIFVNRFRRFNRVRA